MHDDIPLIHGGVDEAVLRIAGMLQQAHPEHTLGMRDLAQQEVELKIHVRHGRAGQARRPVGKLFQLGHLPAQGDVQPLIVAQLRKVVEVLHQQQCRPNIECELR